MRYYDKRIIPEEAELKALFVTRYTRQRGSSRVRVFDLLPFLEGEGIRCRAITFPEKLSPVSSARFVLDSLRLAAWADVVLLQKIVLREAYLDLLKTVNSNLVFDFDDALYAVPDVHTGDEAKERLYEVLEGRLTRILACCRAVIAGSKYLADYAGRYNDCVHMVPSSVAMKGRSPREHGTGWPVAIGWVGSAENLGELEVAREGLRAVQGEFGDRVAIKVFSSRAPDLRGVSCDFVEWTLEEEEKVLRSFDIGIMPLRDNERSRGRCGFKAVQYMSYGAPVVASPVGAAVEVVEDGATGFLAACADEWASALRALISDWQLRARMGRAGHDRVLKHFSAEANAVKVASILRQAAKAKRG